MSGSPGNTSSGGDRARSPRTDNSDITARRGESRNDEAVGANEASAAGGIGIQESNAKHPQPDDANAPARKSTTKQSGNG